MLVVEITHDLDGQEWLLGEHSNVPYELFVSLSRENVVNTPFASSVERMRSCGAVLKNVFNSASP